MPNHRKISTMSATNKAVKMGFMEGTGICIPNAAKKRVMKKSPHQERIANVRAIG